MCLTAELRSLIRKLTITLFLWLTVTIINQKFVLSGKLNCIDPTLACVINDRDNFKF
jgi:hypothetical protein